MYCTGVVHFANRHACVTFWTHSCLATGNSKPDSPYQPACVRRVTSGLRSVRLCTASASWCWINGWNVRQKTQSLLASTPWSHKSHMITLVTVHDFIFLFDHDVAHAFWRHCKQWRWQHVQPLRVHAIQNTRVTIVVQSRQQAVKLMWRYKWILNWYVGA